MAIVLIVEDQDQVRVLAESYLQEQGHQTYSASGIDEALAVFDAADGIDVLFTDIGLKSDIHGGLELARRVVDRQPGLKVLYTTSQAVTDGIKALMVEDSALLEKNYTVDQLQTSLSVNFGIKPGPSHVGPPSGAGSAPDIGPELA